MPDSWHLDFDPDEGLDAQDIFVNRGRERERFRLALEAHHQSSTRGENDPDDGRTPRRNVMVFYGVGGYGKTSLSRWLEDELAEASQAKEESAPKWTTARINLAPHSAWDFDTMLLGVRARLARHGALPAFDIAFRKYWETNHPGVDLADFLRNHSYLRRIAGALNLPDQINLALQTGAEAAAVTAIPGSTAFHLVSSISKGFREGRAKKTALAKVPRFADLLDAADDPEAISHFPRLLAWELYQRRLSLVVFIDGFEELQDRAHRQLELYINRMVWLMPNAFFLITGRNRIDWGDASVPRELDKTGPRVWPGLAAGADEEPRQHLIGELSAHDADEFLQTKVRVRAPGGDGTQPLIPEDIRRTIVDSAEGWPEYLDLSVTLFVKMHREGETPSPADFEKAYEQLMDRICQDLNAQEQAVLRAMSILDGFDLPLAAAAAGQPQGAAVALAARSLIRADPEGFWPYHLSQAISSCVRQSDVLPGAWTAADWSEAARRAVAHLGERYREARAERDRNAVINYLNQSIRLAHEFDLELDWITEGACTYAEDYVWEPTLLPKVPAATRPEDLSTAAQALGLALIAIRERQLTHRSETLATLERCLDSGLLTGDADDFVSYFRAECLRDLGRPDESEAAMARLIGAGRPMSLQASEGVIYAQRRNGRFVSAHAHITDLPASPLRSRLFGDVFWNHALFASANKSYAESRDLAREEGLFGQETEAEASRAYALGFVGGPFVAESVACVRELLGRARIKWAELQACNAELLAAAGTSSRSEFADRCAAAMRAGEDAGLSSITAYAALAGAFDAAVRDDPEALAEARAGLADLVSGRHFHYLLEIVDFWSGRGFEGSDASETDWLDGVEETAQRWRDVVTARRSQGAEAT